MTTKTKTAVHTNPLGDQAKFLRLLYQDAKGRPLPGFVELRAINPDGAGVNRVWVPMEGSTGLGNEAGLSGAIASIRSLEQSYPGRNVYHGVATRVEGGGSKKDVVAAQAVWCDLDCYDEDTGEELSVVEFIVHKPSIAVASGGGLHFYWLLEEPFRFDEPGEREERIARFEAICRGLTDCLGGDRAATDATRILRPPETTNFPDAKKRERGRGECEVRLISADADVRYSLDQLAQFEKSGRRLKRTSGDTRASYKRREWDAKLPERAAQLLERLPKLLDRVEGDTEGLDDESPSGVDMSIASLLAIHKLEGSEIEGALRYWRSERGARDKHDGYFEMTVEKARASAENMAGEPKEDSGDEEVAAVIPMPRTHAANAARFVVEHGDTLRFVERLKSWISFDGKRWRLDLGLQAKQLAKETAQRLYDEALLVNDTEERKSALSWAKQSNMSGGLGGTVEVAKPGLVISTTQLDADPNAAERGNGTLDLRTYELRAHDSADLLTKIVPVPYLPDARCDVWGRALEKSLPDAEMRAFFQRVMGYSLQGGQEAKCFVLVHGPHDGGKSTFIDSCVRTLGTSARKGDGSSDDDSAGMTRYYAETTSIETFGRQHTGNKPELAYLMGARVVVVNEIPEGKALESRTMKAWTGGDAIEATPKYGHPLKFCAGERRRERRWDKSGPAPVVLIMIMSTDIASALSVIDDM